ncbi:hotdog fold thioesterase [Bacillus sp. CGMCC 1.16541]|uniref:hotdog fold thioesterase n=1 Tax=Bacillus sp. CGMCC 1.16541 TaxID=2185143 RepID=UPI000D74003A|nr:hotdog fold thioesterase [Bacillus sp. CGMCC 1.16541]
MELKNTLMEALGIEVTHMSSERVEATMPVDERTRQPFGLLHGGASVALAETVASIGGVASINQDSQACVGLEINANHLRAKKDGFVTAIATPLHKGKKTMVWEVKIVDEQQKLVCISRCTLAVIDKDK